MPMNWLDVVLLILMLLSVVAAFRKGLTREIVGLISCLAALVLGAWFYGMVGGVLEPYVSSRGVANFCGFLIVFCGVMLAGSLAGLLLGRLLKVVGLSFFDRLLGAGFGAVRGLLLAVALVLALMAFTPGVKADSPPPSVVNSRFAPYVIDAARLFAAAAPRELKEGFRKSYEQVKSSWEHALKKGVRESPEAHQREKK